MSKNYKINSFWKIKNFYFSQICQMSKNHFLGLLEKSLLSTSEDAFTDFLA